jgi:hypothetical protein
MLENGCEVLIVRAVSYQQSVSISPCRDACDANEEESPSGRELRTETQPPFALSSFEGIFAIWQVATDRFDRLNANGEKTSGKSPNGNAVSVCPEPVEGILATIFAT